MITSLKILGYRGFSRFEMQGLGRVNLLVGKNNSGKSSVLEALYLLSTQGDSNAVLQMLDRRGEWAIEGDRPDLVREYYLDHLFHGHSAVAGASFTVTAGNRTGEQSMSFTIASKNRNDDADDPSERLELLISGSPGQAGTAVPLNSAGRLNTRTAPGLIWRRSGSARLPFLLVSTDSPTPDELVALWDRVALTSDEDLVLDALRFLDPGIDRIATQSLTRGMGGRKRGGFIVRRKNLDFPVPIGTMGDGMWRMLALALTLSQCKGGCLLVDEIDTGLHHTVMDQMWTLVCGAAKDLDVQVFATTHSYDCVHSLAVLCTDKPDPSNPVTMHRIDKGSPKSVPYDEGEILAAAKHNIEVR